MNTFLQYIAPHHLLTRIVKHLAYCRWHWWKTWAIKRYIRIFQIDLHSALSENSDDYPNLNSFFTRQLKPEARPIVQGANQIACPVDGCISQIGRIENDTLIQAKGFYYSLSSLFGKLHEYANLFQNGKFATLYLSPKDYHRVHLPITGHLKTTIFVPGRLFSVNQKTVLNVPNLFSRNERLICIFETQIGPMAIILVGAMLIGTIQTVWASDLTARKIVVQQHSNIILERGAELGQFNMGSTVIVLFPKNKINWVENLRDETRLQMGQLIATINQKT